MPSAVGNSKPRGRGRGRAGMGGRERLPGGNLPRSGQSPQPQPGNAGNGGTAAPAGRGRGQRGVGKGKGGVGIGGAAMPGPGGRQLAARVASGAITQEQAQKTMQQRQTLAKAFGPNWRDKISAGGQSFAQVNAGLKKNPKDPKLAALRKKLLAGRSSALEAARAKNKGGDEEGED